MATKMEINTRYHIKTKNAYFHFNTEVKHLIVAQTLDVLNAFGVVLNMTLPIPLDGEFAMRLAQHKNMSKVRN